MQPVIAEIALKGVGAVIAPQHIRPGPADQAVVGFLAIQLVRSGAARLGIAPEAAEKDIVERPAIDGIIPCAAIEGIVSVAAEDQVVVVVAPDQVPGRK